LQPRLIETPRAKNVAAIAQKLKDGRGAATCYVLAREENS